FAHSRSSEWDFSGKQSRIFLDARTPSPYGEVKAYLEFDFSASNTNTILNNNQGSVNGYIPRLRQGYATLGGLLMGQTQGTFTDACLGNAAFFNPSQDIAPTLVARWRVEQPWGHIQAGVSGVAYALNDGEFLNKTYLGYGGSLSGNFFTWGKDNLTWGLAGGDGLGDQVANNIGVATNFGGALVGQAFNATDSRSFFSLNRPLYDAAVLATTIVSWSGR